MNRATTMRAVKRPEEESANEPGDDDAGREAARGGVGQ